MSKAITQSLILLLLTYIALLLVYKAGPLGAIYEKYFLSSNKFWHQDHGRNGKVDFKLKEAIGNKGKDAVLSIYNQTQKEAALRLGRQQPQNKNISYDADTITVDIWNFSALGLILMMAIILALPCGWKNKFLALIAGFLLYHIYIWLKMYLLINREYIRYPHLDNNGLSPLLGKINNYCYAIMENIGFSLFIASLTAIMLGMNQKSREKLFG